MKIILSLSFSFFCLFTILSNSTLGVQAAKRVISAFQIINTVAIKDPFYPDYPQRRVLFPTNSLSWWGIYGLSRYTFTSLDSRVGNKTVTFYSSGYSFCPGKGLEMGLPFGNVPDSSYNHYTCTLTKSDDFYFFFPTTATTTSLSVLDSPVNVAGDGSLNTTVYVPLSWWSE